MDASLNHIIANLNAVGSQGENYPLFVLIFCANFFYLREISELCVRI